MTPATGPQPSAHARDAMPSPVAVRWWECDIRHAGHMTILTAGRDEVLLDSARQTAKVTNRRTKALSSHAEVRTDVLGKLASNFAAAEPRGDTAFLKGASIPRSIPGQ